jgi:Spy/CpxP family protein refolding chaperone
MKTAKNFEAIFLAAAVLGTFATYATANDAVRYAPAPVVVTATTVQAPMQVVVIKGQRLTAAQKAQLG